MAILYLYDEISFSSIPFPFSFRRYHSTCSTQFTIIIHFRVTSFGSIRYVYSMSVAVEFRFGSIGFQTNDIKYFRKYQSTLRFSCFNLTKSALRFKNHSIPFCLLQVQVHYTLEKALFQMSHWLLLETGLLFCDMVSLWTPTHPTPVWLPFPFPQRYSMSNFLTLNNRGRWWTSTWWSEKVLSM